MPADVDTLLTQRFLQALKEEQTGCLALLRTPKNPTSFGYGEASGILQGLYLAEQLFEGIIGEEEDRT